MGHGVYSENGLKRDIASIKCALKADKVRLSVVMCKKVFLKSEEFLKWNIEIGAFIDHEVRLSMMRCVYRPIRGF